MSARWWAADGVLHISTIRSQSEKRVTSSEILVRRACETPLGVLAKRVLGPVPIASAVFRSIRYRRMSLGGDSGVTDL